MGCHLCYGDFQHQHFVEPSDLSVVVRMANAARKEVPRPIDYCHMPVPRNRDDEAYFAIPGAALATVEERLAVMVRANQELEKFHRSRLPTV